MGFSLLSDTPILQPIAAIAAFWAGDVSVFFPFEVDSYSVLAASLHLVPQLTEVKHDERMVKTHSFFSWYLVSPRFNTPAFQKDFTNTLNRLHLCFFVSSCFITFHHFEHLSPVVVLISAIYISIWFHQFSSYFHHISSYFITFYHILSYFIRIRGYLTAADCPDNDPVAFELHGSQDGV